MNGKEQDIQQYDVDDLLNELKTLQKNFDEIAKKEEQEEEQEEEKKEKKEKEIEGKEEKTKSEIDEKKQKIVEEYAFKSIFEDYESEEVREEYKAKAIELIQEINNLKSKKQATKLYEEQVDELAENFSELRSKNS